MPEKDRNKLLVETKAMVKSLVIPYKDGVSLRTLCNDYFDIEGRQLPYHDLGFNTLKSFLNSINDVVRMVVRGPNSYDITVFPVYDEATAHIQQMVAEQSKPRGRKTRRPYGGYRPPMSYSHLSYSYKPSSFGSKSFAAAVSVPPQPYRPQPQTYQPQPYRPPQQVRPVPMQYPPQPQPLQAFNMAGLNQMLATQKSFFDTLDCNIIRNQQLCQQQNIPMQRPVQPITRTVQNYSAPVTSSSVSREPLKTMTNQVVNGLDKNDTLNFKPSTIDNLLMYTSSAAITTSTMTTTSAEMRPIVKTSSQSNGFAPTKQISYTSTYNLVTTTTSIAITSTTTFTVTSVSTVVTSTAKTIMTSAPKTSTPMKPSTAEEHLVVESNEITNNELLSMLDFEDQFDSSDSYTDVAGFSPVAIDNFRRVLAKFPHGIPACRYPEEFEQMFKLDFDVREWGYASPMELFYALDKVFAVQPPDYANEDLFPGYGDESFLHDARIRKFHKRPMRGFYQVTDNYGTYNIPEKIVGRIMKMIDTNQPHGWGIDDFCMNYFANYNEEIDPQKFLFKDVHHFFKTLATDVPICFKKEGAVTICCLKDIKLVREWLTNCAKAGRKALVFAMLELPKDIVGPGDDYPKLKLPKILTQPNPDWGGVLITTVVSPRMFWVQMQGTDFYDELDALMDRIDEFYVGPLSADYKVSSAMAAVGLPVACVFPGDKTWQRGRITRVHDNGMVTIYFVDYGGILQVNLDTVRFLKKEFHYLPAQAIRCGLICVKPPRDDGKWPKTSRDRLLDFSRKNHWLACQFLHRHSDDLYEVILCDTTDANKDIYIHQELIDNGVARFKEVEGEEKNNLDVQTKNKASEEADLTNKWKKESGVRDLKVVKKEKNNSDDKMINGQNFSANIMNGEAPKEHNKVISESLKLNQPTLSSKANSIIDEMNKPTDSGKSSSGASTPTCQSVVKKTKNNLKIVLKSGKRSVNNMEKMNLGFLECLEPLLVKQEEATEQEKSELLEPIRENILNMEAIKNAKRKQFMHDLTVANLIWFKDQFWFVRKDLDNLFNKHQLWNTLSRCGGGLKDSIELTVNESKALCSQVLLHDYFDAQKTITLFKYEEVMKLCKVFKEYSVQKTFHIQVKKFQEDIVQQAEQQVSKIKEKFQTMDKHVDVNGLNNNNK